MFIALLIVVYCALIILASLAGGWLPSFIRLTHLRKQLMMSAVSGVMLGVALLHMLPHAIDRLPSSLWAGGSLMCGVLVMFFLIRVFHAHSHTDPSESGHDPHHHPGHLHDHSHDHAHDHDATGKPGNRDKLPQGFSWAGLLIGLTIHSLLDGVALGASLVAESKHMHGGFALLGIGTFVAVVLHKPLDALAITSLMSATHWSDRSRHIVNGLFALTCPLGLIVFWLGAESIGANQDMMVGLALAFSAGFFLCIALADLLPEVAFHSHDRGKLSVALVLGVALAMAVELTHVHEPHPEHEDEPPPTHNHSEHD